MTITILNAETMHKIFSMQEAISVSKEAAKLYSERKCNIPLRANLAVPEFKGQSLYMYGYVPNVQALGVKIVSVYPENIKRGQNSVPATMVLLNAQTGEVSCLLDRTFLTRLRTGAISGAATDLLAKKDSSVFALFGTGGQARSQLEAVLTVRPINMVKVYDVEEQRAGTFAHEMQEIFGAKYDVKISAAKTPNEALVDADVITTVTTARRAVFDGRLVKSGAHINGVGSYTPEMAEIDPYLVTHSKVYVDTKEGALKEAGDLLQPMASGLFTVDRVLGELGDVVSGKAVGRENEEELTFFETTGNAVFDLVTAQKVYEKALALGVGTQIKV